MKPNLIIIVILLFLIASCINSNNCSHAIFPKAEASDFFAVNSKTMYINQNCTKQCKWIIFNHLLYIDAYLFESNGKIHYIVKDSMSNNTDSSRILINYTIPIGTSYNTIFPLYIWDYQGDKPILTFSNESQEIFLNDKFYDSFIVKDTIYKFLFKTFTPFVGDEQLLMYFCRSKGVIGMASQIDEIDSNKIILWHKGSIYGDTLYANKKYNIE